MDEFRRQRRFDGDDFFERGWMTRSLAACSVCLDMSTSLRDQFRGSMITTKAGQTVTGLIVQETAKEVEL